MCLFTILAASLGHIALGLETNKTITLSGKVTNTPIVDVTISPNQIIGTNNLRIGFQLDWHRWKTFIDRPVQQQLAQEAGFSLIRVFDFRKTAQWGIPDLMPCKNWDEATKTGTWDWTHVDELTQHIFDIGAEPLFCLGWADVNIQRFLPQGMSINPETELPYPESYAAYAKEWIKHFRQTGDPVRFYQIMNEPYFYFGWTSDTTKLSHYVELWNVAAVSMRQENPNILLSNDAIAIKRVLDYWLLNGEPVDFVDFHKYDAETIDQYSEEEMFSRAETIHFQTNGGYYGIADAKQKMLNAWGKNVLAICSEGNYNCAWETGTDPKIQQMSGAVWLALVLKTAIMNGLDYNIYFEFSSSKSTQESKGTGWGFGMINEDDNQPWNPYYVNKMIGSNLAIGDYILETQSSSTDIRSIAWVHEGKINILIICKANEPRTVKLQGTNGQIDMYWIDETIDYENPSTQHSTINSDESFEVNGYTVAVLRLTPTS